MQEDCGFKPFKERVVVLPDAMPETIGSIHVAETAKDSVRPQTGTVVAVGPRVEETKVGMKVFFGRLTGYPWKNEATGKEYTIMQEHEIDGEVIVQ